MDRLIPVEGCWVRRKNGGKSLGRVLQSEVSAADARIRVAWGPSKEEWIALSDLQSGFQKSWTVQDVPLSSVRKSLGQGRIVGYRELGGREQLLVQLDGDGRSIWLPYENLRRIKDVRMRYERAETGVDDHAERFRLKILAHALENWNHLTGALDRLDVDPLPHQIQLVHRILSSGNYNWLIADDVGLGKTIEVGLLLAALKRKGQARRVLVVSPSGLTRQWQDEMSAKFDQTYEIYGRDFFINQAEHWKLHDHVVVSIDLAKREDHLDTFRQAGGWDVVVFDEGHKLTRHADGERAQRYRLAEVLRPMADAFLLLSATPHQGYADRFGALLELVRPDLKSQIQALEVYPEVVGEMILRNRKSDVTDAEGNFIFKGHVVHRVPIEPSEQTLRFQSLLRDYLIRGYRAGETGGSTGRAIGFVMTTYRKLASSSIAAIERALELRKGRLDAAATSPASGLLQEAIDDEELAEGGDDQDELPLTISSSLSEEFFALERDLIDELLACANTVRTSDEKLQRFLSEVADHLVGKGKKLLVFTEYRATQSYLKQAIEERFEAENHVLLINGSMTLDEKLAAIEEFNEGDSPFLISTEAGGEGLNLHRSCHIMVNYDLPWNPARLVQRIGRLYRYGQNETVIVINLHAQDTFDNAAIDLLMGRVDQIVRDMSTVGEEFNDRLYAEILGDMLEQLDFASVLQSATSMEISRTRSRVNDALARAEHARHLQDEIFSYVSGYDPGALQGSLGFTMAHVRHFVHCMLPRIGVRLDEESHGGSVLQLRLSDNLRGKFSEFGNRTVVRITTDRRLAQRLSDVVLLDFETNFFQYLVETAQSHGFDGIFAAIQTSSLPLGKIAAFKLRWQNDQGEPVLEELVTVFEDSGQNISLNPAVFSDILLSPLSSADTLNSLAGDRGAHFDKLQSAVSKSLAKGSNRFKHPNGLIPIAAADCLSFGARK